MVAVAKCQQRHRRTAANADAARVCVLMHMEIAQRTTATRTMSGIAVLCGGAHGPPCGVT